MCGRCSRSRRRTGCAHRSRRGFAACSRRPSRGRWGGRGRCIRGGSGRRGCTCGRRVRSPKTGPSRSGRGRRGSVRGARTGVAGSGLATSPRRPSGCGGCGAGGGGGGRGGAGARGAPGRGARAGVAGSGLAPSPRRPSGGGGGGAGGGGCGRGGPAPRGPSGTEPAARWGLGGHARAPRAGGPCACRASWSWGSGGSGVRSPVSVSEGWWLRVVTGDLGVDVLVEGADVVGLQAVAGLPPGLLESVLGGGRGGRAGPAEVEVEVEGEPATVGVACVGPLVRLRLARIRLRLALGAPWCALAGQSAYVIRRSVQCALRLNGGAQWTQGAQGVGLGPVGEGLEGAHAVDAGGDGHLRAELVEGVVQAVEGRVAGTHQSIVVGPLTQVPGLTERGEGDQLVLGVAAADGLSGGAAGGDAALALPAASW